MSAWSPCRDPRPAPARAPDGEALHRRAVPAERIGPDVRGRVAQTGGSWRTRRGRLARISGTRWSRPVAPSRDGPRGPLTTEVRSCTAWPRSWRAARAQLEDELRDSGATDPADEVSRAIDRWVWYAGWADKIAQVAGSANPVAGPYFNFTVPEPTGVVGIVAPAEPSLLGLVSRHRARDRLRERHRRGGERVARRCPRSRSPRRSRPPTSPAG